MSERNVCIYVIQSADGHIKVGTAKNVQKRLRQLQGANPHALTIAHMSGGMLRIIAEQTEFEAHHRLRDKHVQGEWFLCTVEDAKAAISEARTYVSNKRNCWAPHTKVSRSLRTAKPYKARGGEWLS